MNLPRRLELPIDIGGLIVALVVDIVMNVICFATLAPDMITRVAFVSIGVMIVLFVPRSWSKRQFLAWAVFAFVVFFFDYSFSLVATKAQTTHQTVNVYADAEVIRLDGERAAHEKNIVDLQAQYAAAAKRETMDQINSMIKDERALVERAITSRDARINELKRTAAAHAGITSDAIFRAIPDAAIDGRYIELFIFGLIFIGLQLIIATSIDNKTTHKIKPSPVVITDADIDTFVKFAWYRVDAKTSEFILPRDTFGEYMKKKGSDFTDEKYDILLKKCIMKKIISSDGKILELDKEKAKAAIK